MPGAGPAFPLSVASRGPETAGRCFRDFSGYNQDEGVNIFEEFEFEEHQLLDGSQETAVFPKELPLEECDRLMALSEAELVDEGWTIESATRFNGPLLVEQV